MRARGLVALVWRYATVGVTLAQQTNFLPRVPSLLRFLVLGASLALLRSARQSCGSSPHIAAFEATIQTSIVSPNYPESARASMNDGRTVFGYCDGTYGVGTPDFCQQGVRALTLVEFDLSELDENAEVCTASISMQQIDAVVNVGNLVAYPVDAEFTSATQWDNFIPHVDLDTEMIHDSTCEHETTFRGRGRHQFPGGHDFEENIQEVLSTSGESSLRIAIGATMGNQMDSLCKPRSSYDEQSHSSHEIDGFLCTQGVTLHVTYHAGGARCTAAGWNSVHEGCDAAQTICGGTIDNPCICDEVCADQLDSFNRKCVGSVDGVSVGPTQRVNLHRKHMQKCEAITGSLEEKNTLVVIQFAGTTQHGVDPNGILGGNDETLCLTASEVTDQLWPTPGIGVELRACDTNDDGAIDVQDTPDLAKWILRPDGRIQNAATMLCLRRADCAHAPTPTPEVWDLHECASGSVFMTWSDSSGTEIGVGQACPHGWNTPESCSNGCHDCPAPFVTFEGYPKPGGPFHMEEVVGASLVEMVRGTKHCTDHITECKSPQPITSDLIGREGGLCGTFLKQTNTGHPGRDEDAWWIFEQISGPGMSEAQAILSLTLNSHHRNLITASDSGQDSCEPGDSDELNVGCPTLRNALAVALTVPPRDIQLRYVDTANGRVDFQVLGGRAARQAVEEAIDATHTDSENYGILTQMGSVTEITFADDPVMQENKVLAQCNGGAPPGDGPVLGPTVVDRSGCPTDEACNKLWTSGWKPASLHCVQDTTYRKYARDGVQEYLIPDDVQAVNIWISGGGGGLGSQAHPRSTGGAAGFTWATFRVQKEWNNILHVKVGCAGESAGVGVQGVGGGGGGGTAVLDPQGNVLAVAGGAGGQAGAWDGQSVDGMSSTHGGHGGGLQGADGGTSFCNNDATGGGGGGQTQPGSAGSSSRDYDPGQPGSSHNGGDGGGFTASCMVKDETGQPITDQTQVEEVCDDRAHLGCTFIPPSKTDTTFCNAGQACCGVQTIGGMRKTGNITTYGGSGWGPGGMGHTVPCDGGGGGGGGGWRGGGGGGGSCHGTGGGGGSSYINKDHKGYIGGGTLQGRGSMEAVDGWAWIVPVVCDDPPKDHGWKWWQWTLLVLIVAVVGYCVAKNTDRIGDCCGESLAKLQTRKSSTSSNALGFDLETSFTSRQGGQGGTSDFPMPAIVS